MSTKRQREAAARFAATVEECKGDLHPDDIKFEPRNFEDWMRSCDRWDARLLQNSLDMLKVALDGLRPDSSHTKLRIHFRDYAQAAMTRRWPTAVQQRQKPTEFPF